jgi:hypothetical protein
MALFDDFRASPSAFYRVSQDFYGQAPFPAEPTDAEPGTEAKVRVFMARAARHEQLFSPLDKVLDTERGSSVSRTSIREILLGVGGGWRNVGVPKGTTWA